MIPDSTRSWKKWVPKRDVGQVGALLAGDLDQHRGVADVGVGHRHAEPDVAAAAPAAGTHQDEAALRAGIRLSRPTALGHPSHRLRAGQRLVVAGVDQHHVLEVAGLAHLDVAVGGEDDVVGRHVGRDRHPRGGRGEAEGPALEHVERLAVVGELDVDRLAEALLEDVEDGLQLAGKPDLSRPSKVTTSSPGSSWAMMPTIGSDLAVAVDREDLVCSIGSLRPTRRQKSSSGSDSKLTLARGRPRRPCAGSSGRPRRGCWIARRLGCSRATSTG